MKRLRLPLAAALAASCWPAPSAAAVIQAVRIAPISGLPRVAIPVSPLPPSGSLLPLGFAPVLLSPQLLPPSFAPTPAAASAAAPSARERLAAAASAVAQSRDSAVLPSSEASAASSESQFRLLVGEDTSPSRVAAWTDGPAVPKPSGLSSAAPKKPLDPEKGRRVRGMFAGTAAMKIGMETVTLSIPLLVLQAMGGATLVAGLVITYGVAQAAFAGSSGRLLDRLPVQKVLAGAVISQAALVASIIALGATGFLTAWTLFPLYLLIGGAVGIAEISRHSIPPLILGHDEESLSRYNARLHIFYEVAGVVGALATGALITFMGPLWALALQPPAYLISGLLYWRVRLAKQDAPGPRFLRPQLPGLRERIAAYFKDMKAGAGLVLKSGRLRWVAVAFILPQIVHRILESLLAPVFAKRVLMDPGAAGYLLTASNMGELLGAVLLLRYAARIKAPKWVKWGALAMVLSWVMAFTHALPFVLPAFLLMSMTWSAGDLSLRSDVQSSLGVKDQPRATSFMYGAFVLGAAAASLGLGALLDLLPIAFALAGVFALFTAMAAAVFYASRRLKG